jgi:hypothetical protein
MLSPLTSVLEQDTSDDDHETDGCGVIYRFVDDEMQQYQ